MSKIIFNRLAKCLTVGLLPLVLTACHMEKPKSETPKSKTLYPIYTHDCQAIPKEEPSAFLKKFSQLKQGMISDKVVEMLGFQPTYYRQNDDKRLNAPIKYYLMEYNFDCPDLEGKNFIWLKFTTEEKLIEVQFGQNVTVKEIDNTLIFSKSQN